MLELLPDEGVALCAGQPSGAPVSFTDFGQPIAIMPTNHSDTGAAHIPVMLPEVLDALLPVAGEVMVDATFGAGGYSRALLDAGATVIGIDRDPDAIAAAQSLVKKADGKLHLEQGRFSELDKIAAAEGYERVDGVVADIGVSSMQIDQADRGFSFQQEGPLDMRMEQSGPSAADIVNTLDRSDLTRIIGILGDERQASRISAEIVRQRERQPFETTLELARTVEKVIGRKAGDRIHPATRTFQALRIHVNGELEQLARALMAAEQALKPGGRLAIVSFHSLEDRLVKRFLQDRSERGSGSRHLPAVAEKAPTFFLPKRGAISASDEEATINPRSRSAKLRWAVRTDTVPREEDLAMFKLPKLASLGKGIGR